MKKYFLLLIALVFALQTLKAQTVQYLPLYTDNDFAARTLNAKLPVGTTAGALDVSASGGAAYSIPIALPPGTKGVVPSVAVGYNSQGGNGIMGMGWNLSAASAITRTGKNFKYDGVVTPINNNYLDYFALDGNRLEVTSSNYGQEGSTYATKMETFAKITYANNGFLVEAKNGMVYEYGKVENAQFNAQNSNVIIAWYLNKASDQYGNLIAMGVIDPVKVVRTALQNAASVAGLMLTTECLVAERPKDEKPESHAGHGHSHGGF